ncbi:MAG: IPT/TIG domain-containing protein, partial [Myxococcota bacterium]
LENGFTYIDPPTITDVTPKRGSVLGGELITVTGTGFIPGTEVSIGDVQVAANIADSATELTFQAPALPLGVFTVSVLNAGGRADEVDVYQPFETIRLSSMRPIVADVAGGQSVLAVGNGFVPGTVLEIGPQTFESPTSNFEEKELNVLLAPAPEGVVDVIASNVNGEATLPEGFVFVDTSDTTARVVAVAPSAAFSEGGSQVAIVGAGFNDPALAVTFDGSEGDCFVENQQVIRCIAPPGEGLADIRITGTGIDILEVDALRYIPLDVTTVVQDTGSRAGGTWVTIYGDGFDETSRVFFNEVEATGVTAVSATELRAFTPPGVVGSASVRVQTANISRSVGGLFSYFDPSVDPLWTSGGPITGTV